MPNPSSVVDIPTFLEFVKDLFLELVDSIKFLFEFLFSIFDPTYYSSIFSYLPSPFSNILISLVSVVLMIVVIKFLGYLVKLISIF